MGNFEDDEFFSSKFCNYIFKETIIGSSFFENFQLVFMLQSFEIVVLC
jgi:hypothetical protein